MELDANVEQLTIFDTGSTQFASAPCRCSRDFCDCLRNPPASPWILSPARRAMEFAIAATALAIVAAPMLLVAAAVRLTSRGTAVFSQKRVGKNGRHFSIYKFRSMAVSAPHCPGGGLTRAGDQRITSIGRLLRKFKIDELPQFYNVVRGEMSLVGPRPKLPQYAALRNMPYRPGITGAATIAFRNEEELIRAIEPASLDAYYQEHIKPLKARLDVCYMCKATPASDLAILANTFLSCIRPAAVPAASGTQPPARAVAMSNLGMNAQESVASAD